MVLHCYTGKGGPLLHDSQYPLQCLSWLQDLLQTTEPVALILRALLRHARSQPARSPGSNPLSLLHLYHLLGLRFAQPFNPRYSTADPMPISHLQYRLPYTEIVLILAQRLTKHAERPFHRTRKEPTSQPATITQAQSTHPCLFAEEQDNPSTIFGASQSFGLQAHSLIRSVAEIAVRSVGYFSLATVPVRGRICHKRTWLHVHLYCPFHLLQ